ncbi:hypothetical protein JYT83_01495, partial [bacterium AH-315-F18]|nr:hypothetical protein [bacterium AH-315-F18]
MFNLAKTSLCHSWKHLPIAIAAILVALPATTLAAGVPFRSEGTWQVLVSPETARVNSWAGTLVVTAPENTDPATTTERRVTQTLRAPDGAQQVWVGVGQFQSPELKVRFQRQRTKGATRVLQEQLGSQAASTTAAVPIIQATYRFDKAGRVSGRWAFEKPELGGALAQGQLATEATQLEEPLVFGKPLKIVKAEMIEKAKASIQRIDQFFGPSLFRRGDGMTPKLAESAAAVYKGHVLKFAQEIISGEIEPKKAKTAARSIVVGYSL